jgi:hypothetical protein
MPTRDQIWSFLRQTRSLRFVARSGAATGWDGVGTGTVAVSEADPNTIIFLETGNWQPASHHPATQFTNTFRWSLVGQALRLEHLRFGPDQPVVLFDIARAKNGRWRNLAPHHCQEDCYSASLTLKNRRLLVSWSVHGPQKQESILYTYSTTKK